jgi:hypothetical protein
MAYIDAVTVVIAVGPLPFFNSVGLSLLSVLVGFPAGAVVAVSEEPNKAKRVLIMVSTVFLVITSLYLITFYGFNKYGS